MTYRQIEASREIRLWVGQIIIPAAMVTVTIMANPDARKFVKDKFNSAKSFIKSKFKKDN